MKNDEYCKEEELCTVEVRALFLCKKAMKFFVKFLLNIFQ